MRRNGNPGNKTPLACGLGALLLCILSAQSPAVEEDPLTGLQIMEQVQARHQQYPYIYEEQSMVLEDRNGNRDTRRLRRYSRVEQDGSVQFLLVFDYPRDVRGVALLARRDASGVIRKYVYLPAFGEQLLESASAGSADSFLGSDFAIENLTGENPADYHYVRRPDVARGDYEYFVVDVSSAGSVPGVTEPLRRHYVRKDNYYITRTEFFDSQGRLEKVQSAHDLRPVDGVMWRAGMILMDNLKERHQSLIKIDRRVYSHDYVPPEMFSAAWLYEHYPNPVLAAVESTPEAPPGAAADGETGTP